ncbi:MAG TPA: hypothetical protein HA283_01515 [Nanoarchaeota archaeon]|nr:hypothetical protein [Nanoarchaeota archaeon]HIH62951.1 hypothetical protein [Nanoarchaeota archaeon]HIJ10352.1 hypothetical protein [Nanoarchaeota archaeon]
MAKSIETLMEKLKVLVGKQLSEKQMRGALPVQEADRTIVLCSDKPKNVDVLKKLENGEYLRFKQNFEFMRTPDISYGWEIVHTGYYPTKTIRILYDAEGKLKEKSVSNIDNIYLVEDSITRVFEPHGSWCGKRKKN